MKHLLRSAGVAMLALAVTPLAPQVRQPHTSSHPNEDVTLPSGQPQQEEVLKADHERDLKDAAQLIALAEELKKELEKNDRHVLSISSIKKTEEIEKLAKRIRSRIVR